MRRTIARISVGAVIVSGDAAQQVTASIEQTLRQSPITFERLGVSKERVAQDATGNQKARGDQALNTRTSVTP
jgi:hypothetical protein